MMSSHNEEPSASGGAGAAAANESMTEEEMRHYERVNESIAQLMEVMIDPEIVIKKIEELDEFQRRAAKEEAEIKSYLAEINKKYEDITAIANNLKNSMKAQNRSDCDSNRRVEAMQRKYEAENSVNAQLEQMIKEEMMDVDMEVEMDNNAENVIVETAAEEGAVMPLKQEDD